MEKGKDIKSFTTVVIPIYHYDFKNKNGKDIKTTKFIIPQYNVFGNSERLNDNELFQEFTCEVSYDGKNWIII